MKKIKLPLNLQFFGEEEVADTGANETEIAEQSTETETEGATEDSNKELTDDSSEPQSAEVNARFAEMRRKAEANQKQLADRDKMFAERFKGFTNPITGAEIKSEADYFAALDAQDELNRRQELQKKGINPEELDAIIARSPAVIKANQFLAQQEEAENQRKFAEEMETIKKIDSSIMSIDDILKSDKGEEILNKVRAGYSLSDAYKIANYDRITQAKTEASKQAAINAMRGKEHMTQTGGVVTGDNEVEIPPQELAKWKAFYPDCSEAELKKKYNSAMSLYQ